MRTFATVCVVAAVAAVTVGVATSRPTAHHTCTLPCTVSTGLQEDEVGWDYRHGGSVAVYRVTP